MASSTSKVFNGTEYAQFQITETEKRVFWEKAACAALASAIVEAPAEEIAKEAASTADYLTAEWLKRFSDA